MRNALLLMSCLLVVGCSMNSSVTRPNGPAKVNPSSLAADPAAYDGKDVQVTGLLVWEFEHQGLYQSYGALCRGAEKSAIYVEWEKFPGVTKSDTRRMVTVRGRFHNWQGGTQPNGQVLISNAAPGPGPLGEGSVVRWLSPPEKPCPKALP
jgi:hypothetical protein